METMTGRFTIEAGRFVAGQIERALKQYAFVKGVDINIDRNMGIFEGTLLVTVKGSAEKVDWFLTIVEKWLEESS